VDFYGSCIAEQSSIKSGNKSGSPLKAKIQVQADNQIGEIDPDIYGLFMEMCYHEFNGGIWSEMLVNRKFAGDDGEDEYYGIIKPWYSIGKNERTYYAHDNTIYYCGNQSQKIVSENDPNHRCGIGQDNLYFQKSKGYQVRLNLKQKNINGPIVVALEGEKGIYSRKEINMDAEDWSRFSFTLFPGFSDNKGVFSITFHGSGTLWVGSASLMPDDHISGFRRDVIDVLKSMGPSNIRWPGGNAVSVYHWEDGIGDRDERPPRFIRKLWETNDVGIDEFIELCNLVGTKPYVAVNAGNGTPEEAANLVEYCNGNVNTMYGKRRAQNGNLKPYNVKLWGIGNEMFGNWQNGHVDEETYARRHRDMAKEMLSKDSNIKVVATGGRYWKYPRWNQALFQWAGDFFDYLSLHSYAKKYRRHMSKEDLRDNEFAQEFYYYIVSAPYGIEEQLIETDREIRKALPARPDIKIAFDEWNCWAYRAPYEQVDFALRDGLYTAGVFHAFRRQHQAVTLANFSKVVNSIAMIRVNQFDMFLNPQYLVFEMYLNHSGPRLLKTDVKCDSFPAPEYEKGRPQAVGYIPYLDVSATMSEDKKTLYLGIINLNISEVMETEITIKGWKPKSDGKMILLDGNHYMTENTFEKPDNITIKDKTVRNLKDTVIYNFSPHSVSILEYYRQ
jgi:alpha-N-arabinofuranosidase